MTSFMDWPEADTTEKLADIYERFCEHQELPQMTSDQLLKHLQEQAEPVQARVAWLRAFEHKRKTIERFESDILELSRYISAIMRTALSRGQLDEVNRLNALDMSKGCHSHDIIDANIVAYGAFCSMFFREMDCADESDAELVNKAWEIAMRGGYRVRA